MYCIVFYSIVLHFFCSQNICVWLQWCGLLGKSRIFIRGFTFTGPHKEFLKTSIFLYQKFQIYVFCKHCLLGNFISQIYCMLMLSSIFQIKACGFHLPTKEGVGGRAIPAALAVW